ncbi:MAG: TetR/AcrR family transcriptional regulator [Panacagrimonas sp.]
MGRPAKPLISRDRATRAALGVIDVHGLEALSLELVAQRMGVRAPSLYYHFKHKAELLSEIARLLLLDVQVPEAKDKHWKQALLDLSLATRRSILQHPNAAPLLLQFFPRHLLLAAYDHWISISPLPPEMHMVMIEGLEKITLGSALFEASHRSRAIEPMPAFDRAKLPHLSDAIRANGLGDEALFLATMTAFLDGLQPAQPETGKATKRPSKRKAPGGT